MLVSLIYNDTLIGSFDFISKLVEFNLNYLEKRGLGHKNVQLYI